MKWWKLVIGVGLLLLVVVFGVVSWEYAPWWRVGVNQGIPGVRVNVSRWKTARLLKEWGVWEQGVIVPGSRAIMEIGDNTKAKWLVPKRVEIKFTNQLYSFHQMSDKGQVFYSAKEEMVGDRLIIWIGVPNIRYFGQVSKMEGIMREGLLSTWFEQVRIVTKKDDFDAIYRDQMKTLPKNVTDMVRIYEK